MKMFQKGFTLLELLAVLAILAIISSLAVPRVMATVSNSRKASMGRSIENILHALQRFCVEQELKSPNQSCPLTQLPMGGGEWSGADHLTRDPAIDEVLQQYLANEVPEYLTVRIDIDESSFLTPPGYGCISIWYPSLDSNGSRVFLANTDITDFNINEYTKTAWDSYTSQGHSNPIDFIYDTGGVTPGPDNENDFAVFNIYFEINDLHSHVPSANNDFYGDNGDNVLYGTPESDNIYGYGGNDVIYGQESDDFINGGEGNDTAVFSRSILNYTITTTGPDVYEVSGPDGCDTLSSIENLQFADVSDSTDNIISFVEALPSSTGGVSLQDDIIIGNDDVNSIYGLSGGDYIAGNGGNDTIYGGMGNDFISGGSGNDNLRGLLDDDTLYGCLGNDILLGGSGNDHLKGGVGDDDINGGTGQDIALYSYPHTDYTITRRTEWFQTIYTIEHPIEGIDTLTNVERLEFSDLTGTIEEIFNLRNSP